MDRPNHNDAVILARVNSTPETVIGKLFNVAKSVSVHSLTIGGIYLTGYLNLNPLWLLFPVIWLTMRDQMTAEKEFKQRIAMFAALKNEKQLVHSQFEYLPSWVHFPDVERCEWFNIILARMWPNFNIYAMEVIKSKLEVDLNKKLSAYLKDSFKFQIMSLGSVPPRVSGVKVYEKNVKRNELVVDIHIFYAGDCDLSCKFLGLTAGVQNFQVRGLVRLVLKPLMATEPLIGGVDIYFLNRPSIDFKLVGVADIPGLGGRIRTMIDDQVSSAMVMPNKIHFSLSENVGIGLTVFPEIEGVLCVNVIEARDLVNSDFSLLRGQDKSDPFLILSVGEQTFRSTTVKNSLNPEWNFHAEFIVKDLYGDLLRIEVMDEDRITEDTSLGNISVHIDLVRQVGEMDTWMQLEDTKTGTIHFYLVFFILSSNKEDYWPSYEFLDFPSTPSSILEVYIDSANNLMNSQSGQKPDSSAIISVGNNVQVSKLVSESDSPVFEEVFMFLLINPELDKLQIQMIDKKHKFNMGHISFKIIELLTYDKMQLTDQSFPLDDSPSDSTVRLSIRLRFLKKTLKA